VISSSGWFRMRILLMESGRRITSRRMGQWKDCD
jgi:hypothetical protein